MGTSPKEKPDPGKHRQPSPSREDADRKERQRPIQPTEREQDLPTPAQPVPD